MNYWLIIIFIVCLGLYIYHHKKSPIDISKYYVKNVIPGKQYIIEDSPRPRNIRYLIDTSDLNYYKNNLQPIVPLQQIGPIGPIGPICQRTLMNPSFFERPRLVLRPRIFDINPIDIQQDILNYGDYDFNEDINLFHDFTGNTEENKQIKDEAIRKTVNDPQSVHDTIIQSATRSKYKEITPNDKEENKEEILNKIINHNPKDEKKIKNIIDQIRKRNSKVTNFNGDTEVDILVNVYSKGNDNVKCQVINELLDSSKALGLIDCPTGVTTRIVNASFIDNPEDIPKSKTIIQQEMLQNAAHFRNTYEGKDEHFKDALREKYYLDYTGIMSNAEIDDTINEWIDHV